MFRIPDICSKGILLGGLVVATFVPLDSAHAKRTFSVLYSFTGGSDGGGSVSPLILDKSGNLYGTTIQGGTDCGAVGCGTVFELAPDGTETPLYAFTGGANGDNPEAGLLMDKSANLYGTTFDGGISCKSSFGCGTVFKLAPGGAETVLYAFTKKRGANPESGLIEDKAGNLYGTAPYDGRYGYGSVFKLAPDGKLTVLYAFANGDDGGYPQGGLIRDNAGNLYGTTVSGGTAQEGVVFEIAPDGSETMLYSFQAGNDGAGPAASLIQDKQGNFYGTTFRGGGTAFSGTVFKLAPDGTETVLYAFSGGSDGGYPDSSLLMDKAGNLYGTALAGGVPGAGCTLFASGTCGVVFKLAPNGTETVLHAFTDGSDGAYPYSGVIADKKGNLYGTAWWGGANLKECGGIGCGTVFELKK
jgi:uncharacterized repeat protein (TIGR03803 family)